MHSDETPNAVEIGTAEAEVLLRKVDPLSEEEMEIGMTGVSESALQQAAQALEVAPPLRFDLMRQVRVFQPYIQYVEINLSGCAIKRRRVEIPKSIQRLGPANEIQKRLRTTLELIERDGAIPSDDLNEDLKLIRDEMTQALGPPWGRIMLRSARPRFDQRIAEFRQRLNEHKAKLQSALQEMLDRSRQQAIAYYLPIVQKSPPDSMLGQLMMPKPDSSAIRDWLDGEFKRSFPLASSLLEEIRLDVQFKDVTFETLIEPGFADVLKKAYPHVNWDKPFNEFNAAQQFEGWLK